MSVNDDDLNEVADEDEKLTDPKGNVLGEGSPKMVPGENLKMLPPPPRPAFGSGKLLDLTTGKVRHPSLGEEVDASEFIQPLDSAEADMEPAPGFPSLPPGSVRGTPMSASGFPPFQLPGDEDDPAGSVPAHHVEPRVSDDFRAKIEAQVVDSMENWENHRVEKSQKYLEDARAIAADIAKTVKSVVDALAAEGFSRDEALALAQMVVEKKFQPFL